MSYGRGDEENKLFVGGLTWETTSEQLREYFSQWGNVIQADVVTDQTTGRSRGFGFVKYDDASAISAVENHGEHNLNNRTIDPKRARPRGERTGGGGRGGVSCVHLFLFAFI